MRSTDSTATIPGPRRAFSGRVLRGTLLTLGLALGALLGQVAQAAEYVWASADVSAQRWQDAAAPTTGEVKTNDRLEVIFRTPIHVRVRLPKSPKFGWLPVTAVTATQPAGAEGAPAGASLDGLSPELQKALEQLQNQGGNPEQE